MLYQVAPSRGQVGIKATRIAARKFLIATRYQLAQLTFLVADNDNTIFYC